jgi:hypothetical protein
MAGDIDPGVWYRFIHSGHVEGMIVADNQKYLKTTLGKTVDSREG